MSRYSKGANFEREIVRGLWKRGWAAMRATGSGSVSFPVPDVIAIKDGNVLLIECKTTKKERINLKKAVESLKSFSDISGGSGYIVIKFPKSEPRFYEIDYLLSRKNFTITDRDKYLTIDAVIGKQMLL
ncbi:MAG: hypothetical protein DRO92_00420 [Candidatus Altiarchaeales archaeon]|nr:MAG: hypothetical protein DRO92_00420 [Candidatus Altiarchaeales archaeon]